MRHFFVDWESHTGQVDKFNTSDFDKKNKGTSTINIVDPNVKYIVIFFGLEVMNEYTHTLTAENIFTHVNYHVFQRLTKWEFFSFAEILPR